MAQVLTQSQQLKQGLRLHTSQQQLLTVKLLEMPIAEYEQFVKNELTINPALEDVRFSDDSVDGADGGLGVDSENDSGDDPYSQGLDDDIIGNVEQYGEDDLPVYNVNNGSEKRNDLPLGDSGSFIEDLEAQMMNFDLDETQQQVMRYLIGLLDNRGYISTPASTIAEELAFKCYIFVDENYVNEMLKLLQRFEPAGIGAKDTRECLLLQIDRELNEDVPISELKEQFILLQRRVVADYYDLFINRNEERLQRELGVSSSAVKAVFAALRKLNINPGLSLSESSGSQVQTLVPDFIINTDPDGNIEMHLNSGDVPRMHVRRDYIEQLKLYETAPGKFSQREREGLIYTRQKVESAQQFIESVKQRRRSLYDIMQAIITLQRKYILSRDEEDKVRLVQKDVAKMTGYEISTVSRVCNSKCCMLDGRIYPLSTFFKLTRQNADGKDIDSRKVLAKLRKLIDTEDKSNPLSDEQLANMLASEGIRIARRTVTRYRNANGIPPIGERKVNN